MIYKTKILGLTFLAMLAMSGVTAGTVTAAPSFTASTYPATVTGANGFGSEALTTEVGGISCDSHFVSNSITGEAAGLTLTPTYSKCQHFFGFTLNTEGCTYVLKATVLIQFGVYKHHVDIACPEGKSIKFGSGACKSEIKSQAGLTTVETTNSGSSLTLEWELANITLIVTGDPLGCPFNGTGTKIASYHGDVVLSRVGGGSVSVSGS